MMMEVALPAGLDRGSVEQALRAVRDGAGRRPDDPAAGAGRPLEGPPCRTREVLRYPHPALKRAARPLERRRRELTERVAADLVDTMRANQRLRRARRAAARTRLRMVVVDVSEHPRATAITGCSCSSTPDRAASGSEVAREGCLSIPDLTANVRRATEIVGRGADPARASRSGSRPRASRPAASSTRSTTSTASCSSTASTRLKTDVFRRKRYR